MIWIGIGLGVFALLISLAIVMPEISEFARYMGACARRWWD